MLTMGNFSLNYIKMCEKNHLLFFYKMHKGKLLLAEGDYYWKDSEVLLSKKKQLLDLSSGTAWLPTTDELIDIIGCSHTQNLVRLISSYLEERQSYLKDIDANDNKSVLLAIYMHSRYKKVWKANQWMDIEM